MSPAPATAAIYARISKDAAGLGLGVERQEAECRALAERLELDVAEVYVDNDVSAYKGKPRPGYEALVESMKAGTVGTVIAWHPDRLTRHTRELEDLIDTLEATRTKVHTVQAGEYDLATPSGRMQARIIGAVARGESEHKSARLRSKMDQLAESGSAPGGRPPYGYRRAQGTYEVDLDEAPVVRRIAADVLAGESLLGIARTLNAEGIPTREGRPWHHSTVRAVVINPAVAGHRVHRREVVGRGVWTPILDEGTAGKVRQVLGDPARKQRRPRAPYVLTGIVQTTEGVGMVGRMDKGRRTYVTPSAGLDGRTWVGIDADKLEAIVVEQVLAAFDDVALPAPEAVESDAATLEAELEELARLRGEGVISLAEWVAARDPLVARLDAARTADRAPAPVALAGVPGEVRRAWPDLDYPARRRLLAEVLEAVVVAPAGGMGRGSVVANRTTIQYRLAGAQT